MKERKEGRKEGGREGGKKGRGEGGKEGESKEGMERKKEEREKRRDDEKAIIVWSQHLEASELTPFVLLPHHPCCSVSQPPLSGKWHVQGHRDSWVRDGNYEGYR